MKNLTPDIEVVPMKERVIPDPTQRFAPLMGGQRLEAASTKVKGFVEVGSLDRGIFPGDDIQRALDLLNIDGGGILRLHNGTYNISNNIILYDSIAIVGESSDSTIIDFGGGAYQVQVFGSNPYSTGTVTVSIGSTSVTGSGTAWTSSMVGQFILLQGIYFEIASVNTPTSITLVDDFSGVNDLTNATYVIATPISDVRFERLTFQNSTATTGTVHFRYSSGTFMEKTNHYTSTIGFTVQDSDLATIRDNFSFGNTSHGAVFNHVGLVTYDAFNCLENAGDGINMTKLYNTEIKNFTTNANNESGIHSNDSSDIGIYDFSCSDNGSQGVFFENNTDEIELQIATINNNGSDGIKLGTNCDRNIFSQINFRANSGFDVNVSGASNTQNLIAINVLKGDSGGTVNDAGTNTKIRSNIGVADAG